MPRADFECALRHLKLSDLELRDAVLMLGARLLLLTDELARRLDCLEPDPVPPATLALKAAGMRNLGGVLSQTRVAEAALPLPGLNTWFEKYTAASSDPPFDEGMGLVQRSLLHVHFLP